MDLEEGKREAFRPLKIICAALVLAIVPFIFLFCTKQLNDRRGPLWLGTNSDPTYCYLLNSLLIINHEPTFLIEHPGTSAQIGGAIILRARHLGLSPTELTDLVLTQPEVALRLIISTVNATTSCLIFVLGALLYHRSGNLALPLLFQSTLLFFDQTYFNSVFFAPELFFAPLCLVLGCVYFYSHDRTSSTPLILIAGILAACCIMVKYTFVPFLALGLIVFETRRAKVLYLAAFLLTLAAFIFFIRHELTRTWQWVSNLATHSGRYGGGPKQIADWPHYVPTLVEFLKKDPLYLPLLLSGLIVPSLSFWKQGLAAGWRDRTTRTLLFLTVLEAVCFIITAKHPAPHYLMPLVAMTPLHILLLGKSLESLLPQIPSRLTVLGMVLIAGFYFGSQAYHLRSVLFPQAAADQIAATKILAEIVNSKKENEDCQPVFYYRTSSLEYSLYFGNGYARGYFSSTLNRLYPRAWFFNIFNARYQSFTETITGDEFYSRYPHPLFFGSNSIEAMPFGLVFPIPSHGILKQLWRNEQTFIHEIEYQ